MVKAPKPMCSATSYMKTDELALDLDAMYSTTVDAETSVEDACEVSRTSNYSYVFVSSLC